MVENEPTVEPKASWLSRLKRPFREDPQDPDLASRIIWGALFGVAAFVAWVPFSGFWEACPLITMVLLLGVFPLLFAGYIVFLARARCVSRHLGVVRVFQIVVFPLAVGILMGSSLLGFPSDVVKKNELGELVAEHRLEVVIEVMLSLVKEHANERGVAFFERFQDRHLLFPPIVIGVSVAITVAAIVAAIRLRTGARLKRRLLIYGAVPVAMIVAEWLVFVFLFWPPLRSLFSIHPDMWIDFLPLLVWGIVVDVGQTIGGWQPLARHPLRSLAGIAGILAVAAVIAWRPLTAESYFLKWRKAPYDSGSDRTAAKQYLTKAYRLCPENEWIACEYADEIVGAEGIRLYQEKNYAAAIEKFQRAIRIYPRDPWHYNFMAGVLCQMGEHARAIEYAREADRVARQTKHEDRPIWERHYSSGYDKTIIWCLVAEGSSPSIAEALSYLDSESVGDLEIYAAETFARYGVTSAIDPIKNLLKSAEIRMWPEESARDGLRKALITCLAADGRTTSVAEILTFLDSEEAGDLEIHAAEVLAALDVKEAIGPIKNLLRNAKVKSAPEESSREKLQKALDKLERVAK